MPFDTDGFTYDYDLLDFDNRDALDAEFDLSVASFREEVTGLAARPGVRR